MSPNTIWTLPKESDTPSGKVIKKVGVWMIPNWNWSLILTRFSNKGILTWLTKKANKKNAVEEAITPPISEKIKLTQSTKQRNQKHTIRQ